jgi:hypothetical protein
LSQAKKENEIKKEVKKTSGIFGFNFFGKKKEEEVVDEPKEEVKIEQNADTKALEDPDAINMKDLTFTSIENLPELFTYLRL